MYEEQFEDDDEFNVRFRVGESLPEDSHIKENNRILKELYNKSFTDKDEERVRVNS